MEGAARTEAKATGVGTGYPAMTGLRAAVVASWAKGKAWGDCWAKAWAARGKGVEAWKEVQAAAAMRAGPAAAAAVRLEEPAAVAASWDWEAALGVVLRAHREAAVSPVEEAAVGAGAAPARAGTKVAERGQDVEAVAEVAEVGTKGVMLEVVMWGAAKVAPQAARCNLIDRGRTVR